MATKTIESGTVADAYLAILKDRGVDYFFGNAGTDFAPIIEAFARAHAEGTPAPIPLMVPHENVAINMALGYYIIKGRPQVVMVHVNAGTANAICGLINASKGNLPVLFTAGRTPYTEEGDTPGMRSREVHWPQEMRDQNAMVREMVKWDYELPSGAVVETAVDRALNVAMSSPRGPVYMTLPREPLAAAVENFQYQSPSLRRVPAPAHPDPAAIDEAAAMLAKAERPLIIASNFGAQPADGRALAELAERYAVPVSQRKPRFVSLPSAHPMNIGYDPDPYLDQADLIVVLEADVPWIPSMKAPGADCKIIHIGADPIFESYPIRGFRCDLAITGLPKATLTAISGAMAEHEKSAKTRIDARRKRIADEVAGLREKWKAQLEEAKSAGPIHPVWISHCIDRIKGDNPIIIKESGIQLQHLNITETDTVFTGGAGGGLGYGLGTALGAKLAAPDRLVICTQGDGAYHYGNPVPSHYVAKAEGLPMLTVVFNNARWDAVRRNTRAVYPDGYASRSNREPLTYFEPGVAYEHAVEVVGGYGECVEDPEELPRALDRAMDAIESEDRQALLNVITA